MNSKKKPLFKPSVAKPLMPLMPEDVMKKMPPTAPNMAVKKMSKMLKAVMK